MQGAVLRTEESVAEWVRPCTHILSPATRRLEVPRCRGEEVETFQGSKQEVIS